MRFEIVAALPRVRWKQTERWREIVNAAQNLRAGQWLKIPRLTVHEANALRTFGNDIGHQLSVKSRDAHTYIQLAKGAK